MHMVWSMMDLNQQVHPNAQKMAMQFFLDKLFEDGARSNLTI